MIYLIVISSASVFVGVLLAVRAHLRRHNVRRIVRRMGKHTMHPSKEHEVDAESGCRSSRSAAIGLHHARKLLRDAEREWKKGDATAAEHSLISAITNAPGELDAQIQLGLLYMETGRAQKAQAVFEPLTQRHADPNLWSHLARALGMQQQWKGACAAYRKALDLDPGNPHREADLGHAFLQCGQAAEAAIALERALKQLPRRIDLLRLLAQCYERDNNPGGAMSAYRRINRLDPRDEGVRKKITMPTAA